MHRRHVLEAVGVRLVCHVRLYATYVWGAHPTVMDIPEPARLYEAVPKARRRLNGGMAYPAILCGGDARVKVGGQQLT